MSVAENIGWRSWFRYRSGESYTVLLKGSLNIVQAAVAANTEAVAHGVQCIRLERWRRDEDTRRAGSRREQMTDENKKDHTARLDQGTTTETRYSPVAETDVPIEAAYDDVVAELERLRSRPDAPEHEATKRGFYNGRSGWGRHFGRACEDLDHFDYMISDLVTVELDTRNLMRREVACVRTHLIDAYDEATTGYTETERRLWGTARKPRPGKHRPRKLLSARPDESTEVCLICGHEPCGGCENWCDNLIIDDEGDPILCCAGECTYTEEELHRKLAEDRAGFLDAVRDSAEYTRAWDVRQVGVLDGLDRLLCEAIAIAEDGNVPGPETLTAWKDTVTKGDENG